MSEPRPLQALIRQVVEHDLAALALERPETAYVQGAELGGLALIFASAKKRGSNADVQVSAVNERRALRLADLMGAISCGSSKADQPPGYVQLVAMF